jgi:hypothetical protein
MQLRNIISKTAKKHPFFWHNMLEVFNIKHFHPTLRVGHVTGVKLIPHAVEILALEISTVS